MGKSVICHTLAMSNIIIVWYSCMITTCMSLCICTGVSKNSRSSTIYVHKKTSLIWPDPFLVQGVYHLQYKHLANKPLSMVVYATQLSICAESSSRPTITCSMLCTDSYYFHFELWSSYTPIDLSLTARTIHNTYGSYL